VININSYYTEILEELNEWKKKTRRKPSIINNASKTIQNKFNSILPEPYHEAVTAAIKTMVKAVLTGSQFLSKKPYLQISLPERENLVKEKINFYRKTAMIEGAGTGAGGFLIALADFPLLLSIKIKLLYDIAAIYGFDTNDYKERLYILHIFQLAFSSQAKTNQVFSKMENWEEYSKTLPDDINLFNWRDFQQEYRDYIDIAKLMQMLPVIGALVGMSVNSKLINKLGITAMNSYRMRIYDL